MRKRQCSECERWVPADALFMHDGALLCRSCIEADDVRCGRCQICKELSPPAVACEFCGMDIPSGQPTEMVQKKLMCHLCFLSFQAGVAAARESYALKEPEATD